MTVRAELDAYCLSQTLQAGVQFLKTPGVKVIEQQSDRVLVDTGREVLCARFLVGADGVNSSVRRFCAGAGEVKKGFALEAQVPMPAEPVNLTFDFGAVRNGYGWIFPKGDHLNVGLGYYTGRGEDALNRERLMEYIGLRLGTNVVDHVVGQFLGIADINAACDYRRILLAGDAAGLVDPLTGEGIYSAVISGQAAAKAIDSGLREAAGSAAEVHAADSIYRETLAPLREVLAFSTRAAGSFYANPDRGFQAAGCVFAAFSVLSWVGGGQIGLASSIVQTGPPS
jgi:flavin-dependent dehydrogenase